MVLEHSRDVQLLEHENVVLREYLVDQFVLEVLALAFDM